MSAQPEKPKMLLTRRWPEQAEARARERFDVSLNSDDQKMSAAQLREAVTRNDVVCPTVSDLRIDNTVLDAPQLRCRILCNFGVGFDNIDIEAAKARGIVVTNTPGVLTDCTADIAMTLLLMVARRTGEGERLVRAGQWRGWCPTHMLATRVSGKKLGLVGFGRIAKAVAQRAHFGFSMHISCYDPCPPSDEILSRYQAALHQDLDALLGSVDFVSLHCPGGGANTHLINARRLAAMQRHAFLINSARGDVVDEAALIAALQEKRIAGAALDVHAREPAVSEALLTMDNVVLFPHLGSASTETRLAMGLCALDNAEAFFAGRKPPNRVA